MACSCGRCSNNSEYQAGLKKAIQIASQPYNRDTVRDLLERELAESEGGRDGVGSGTGR